MLTNAGMDMQEIARELERRKSEHQFDVSQDLLDQSATPNEFGHVNASTPIVVAGSEEDVNDEYSFVREADVERAAQKRIRKIREFGHMQRAGFLTDADGRMLGPKLRDKFEVEAVAEGLFCWKCMDAQPSDKHMIVERQEKLKGIGWILPTHLKPEDCCCTCGAVLGLKAGAA